MANEENLKRGKATQFRSGEEAARTGQKGHAPVRFTIPYQPDKRGAPQRRVPVGGPPITLYRNPPRKPPDLSVRSVKAIAATAAESLALHGGAGAAPASQVGQGRRNVQT